MGSAKRPEDSAANALTIPDHQMMRRIGDGSYGEVWLARSATGALRAVKIVRRDAFDSDKPFEREFNGLLHFEPLSRGHEGLVDILQVGRSSSGDSFYCIMELADAALPQGEDGRSKREDGGEQPPANGHPQSSILDPRSYHPLTLDVLIRQHGGRLPVKECLAIASTLAGALQYLHNAGLVHRDIKPSNIIFVGGVPKLADVGLVARADSARTFVGTEGFLPPEGPGTPQADIYSLGKCLYEMAMGKDRHSFPSPPTLLDELPDRAELLELNEIITKACDPEPRRRYHDASALGTDLQALAASKSLQRIRCNRRLNRIAACAVCAALLLWLAPEVVRTWKRLSAPPLQLVSAIPLPEGEAGSAKVGDFNGDGEAELITVSNNGEIVVLNRNGTRAIRRMIRGFQGETCQLSRLADVGGDGREVPIVFWRQSTNLFISVFNEKLLEREPRLAAHGLVVEVEEGIKQMEGYFTPVAFCPPRGKEPAQLLTVVSVGRGRQPRELRCYNLTNGTLLWQQQAACTPGSGFAVDLEGCGRRVWVVGLDSTDNGVATPDGEDDSRSYLHCYDADGHRLWSTNTGGVFTHCTPMILDLHGSKALYAMVETREEIASLITDETPASGRVISVSAEGKIVNSHDAGAGLYSLHSCDLNGDGTPEILATDGQGHLHVLNPDLKLLRKVPISPRTHDWVELWLDPPPADLNGDGRPELVFRSSQVEFVSGQDVGNFKRSNNRRYHDVSVYIYDASLKRTATHRLFSETKRIGVEVFFCPTNRDGTRDLAILSTNAQFLKYRPTKLWQRF
ncbi:MAG TPA: FG-GAP-like repeat-containing protein [Verrucomicrobiae bacterium]